MLSLTKQLLVVGCSATKVETHGELPAISLYDGPAFRTLRAFLRERHWSETLSAAVLSAKHGLIGGLTPVGAYDQRMTRYRAAELRDPVTATLLNWKRAHSRIDLVVGKDYLRSIAPSVITDDAIRVRPGPIGKQLNHIAETLRRIDAPIRPQSPSPPRLRAPLYFLPDWDDFLDIDFDFDFERDRFSFRQRRERREAHSIELMRPYQLCDGVLVSLAQHLGTKGLLKRVDRTSLASLAPRSVRKHFGLAEDQWAFGDCGAFTYVGEPAPTISVEQAVALYDFHEFDFGASVLSPAGIKIPTPPDGRLPGENPDTDVCIEILRGNAQVISRRSQILDQVATTWITACELSYGAARSRAPRHNQVLVVEFLATLLVIGLDMPAAERFGQLKAKTSWYASTKSSISTSW